MGRRPLPIILVILFNFFIVAIAFSQDYRGGGFAATSSGMPNWYTKSVALVIGINNYSAGWPSLSAACNDADRVAGALRAQGFDVYELKDRQATKGEIMRHLYNVVPPLLSENDRFLLYFAGHGQTQDAPSGQLGYIVPFDGKREGGTDQWYTYISMQELRDVLLHQYKAKHILIIADSCFSGLLTTKSIGGSSDISHALQYKGRMVLTAGGKGEQAVDGLFAPVLVDALNGQCDINGDGAVTFSELSLYVQQNVASKSDQRPVFGWWEGNGDMVFKPVASAGAPPLQVPNQPPSFAPSKNMNEPPHFDIANRFEKTSCGSIIDKQTGLEWYVGPDKSMTWKAANNWVQSVTICGGGWRMPKREELRTLFMEEAQEGNIHLPKEFKLTGSWVWSCEINASNAWCFSYTINDDSWIFVDFGSDKRALAVRPHKKNMF